MQMMQGYLRAEGITVQRRRVREMLTRVDPAAAAQRWSNVVARRSYHVPFPNSLWHIQLQSKLFNPHCVLGLLANCKIFLMFAINKVDKNS